MSTVAVLCCSAQISQAGSAIWNEQGILVDSGNGAAQDQFGTSVEVSGDTAIVGAATKTVDAQTQQGQAYIFVHTDTGWSPQGVLTASDGAAGDVFGTRVAVSGDTAVVAAPGSHGKKGQVYVFVRTAATWSQQAILTASDGSSGDSFGSCVAASGDTILIGAPHKSVDTRWNLGQAYVFVRTGTLWSQQAILALADGVPEDYFGMRGALSDDTAVLGMPNRLAAYVFVRMGTMWSQEAILTPFKHYGGGNFGASVSVSRNLAVVGAPFTSVYANANQGMAYVFGRQDSQWSGQANLIAEDGAAGDYFGSSVSVSGNFAVVGAPQKTVGGKLSQGESYMFLAAGQLWRQQAMLTALDGAANDHFGGNVAISGSTVVIGAASKTLAGNPAQGQAYAYSRRPNGTGCTSPSDCATGYCVDGVCCNEPCGRWELNFFGCMSCLGARTGGADGTCGLVTAAAQYACQPSDTACSAGAMCDGQSASCPSDSAAPQNTMCQDEAGNAGLCDGVTRECSQLGRHICYLGDDERGSGCSCRIGSPVPPPGAPLLFFIAASVWVLVRYRRSLARPVR